MMPLSAATGGRTSTGRLVPGLRRAPDFDLPKRGMSGRRRPGQRASRGTSADIVVPMSIPAFRRRRARRIGAAARAVAQRTPETLTVARRRAQPTAVTVARLAGPAVFAYLGALPPPVNPQPMLAPLAALLCAQVSLYQTLSSAVRRVAAVVIGVLLAVRLSAWGR